MRWGLAALGVVWVVLGMTGVQGDRLAAWGRPGMRQYGALGPGGSVRWTTLRAGALKKAKKGAKGEKDPAKEAKAEAAKDSRNMVTMLSKEFKKLRPATRTYLAVVMSLTMAATFGVLDPALLALDPVATIFKLQFWRPLSSAFFLGGLSMPLASSLYFVVMYGQELERDRGTADYVMFLISQVVLLTLLGPMLGMPFTSSSLVSAALWVSCRRRPMQRMQLGFMGMALEAWLVPFGRMGIDCLQAQSGAAALPHLVGFVTGHLYHFVTRVWPLLGGRDWLQAPAFMKKVLDGKKAKKTKKKGGVIKKKKKKKVPTGTGFKLGAEES